jgi:hypothetical protein
MRRLRIDMQALIDAMAMPEDVPWRSFLDLRAGVIVEVGAESEDELDAVERPEVELDPERYHEIPLLESREEYDVMAAFAASAEDDELCDQLGDALHGRGAFSRFRRVVDSEPGLRECWFAFRRDELIRRARRWLASLDVEPLYETAEAAEPSPAPAPATPPIGLLDLLLLGGPDGKTELLDGRVLRQIHAPTASEARRLFTRVARELCWHFDRPWRKRYVEGETAFDIDRAHLVIHGTLVQLWVEVPLATWKAFG